MSANSALSIVNGRGVSGTAACLAWDLHDGRAVLLTTHHVLFGSGAREGEPVWLLDDYRAGRRQTPIGWSQWGKVGSVSVSGEPCHVDCAIASWMGHGRQHLPRYHASLFPRPGETVEKTGAASGQTMGVIEQVGYTLDQGTARSRLRAHGQLLVRPQTEGQPFTAAGDSGALLLNERGHAVGLLWGVNAGGAGLASPIGAVLHALNIALQEPPA